MPPAGAERPRRRPRPARARLQPLPRSRRGRTDGALLKKRAALLFCGWGWAAAIVVLSLIPNVPTPSVSQSDKLEHFAAYGLLMFLFCQIYHRTRTRLVYAAGFIAMGIAMEFLQRMTGYRTFEVLDMVANATGVVLGGGAAGVLAALRRNRG